MIKTLENASFRLTADSSSGTRFSLVNKETGFEHMWVHDYLHLPNIMFPHAGKFVNDEYVFEGNTYSMPEHGFLRYKDLEDGGSNDQQITFRFVSDQETLKIYPFEFRFDVRYTLSEKYLEIRYEVTNTDTKALYYSLACHQGYAVPIDPACSEDSSYLEFEYPESADTWVIHDDMQVDDEMRPFIRNEKKVSLSHLFDEGGIVLDMNEIRSRWIEIRHKDSASGTRVEFPDAKYLILSSLAGNPEFVCIEPWHGMFQRVGHDGNITTRWGINLLEPGKTGTMTQRVYPF